MGDKVRDLKKYYTTSLHVLGKRKEREKNVVLKKNIKEQGCLNIAVFYQFFNQEKKKLIL